MQHLLIRREGGQVSRFNGLADFGIDAAAHVEKPGAHRQSLSHQPDPEGDGPCRAVIQQHIAVPRPEVLIMCEAPEVTQNDKDLVQKPLRQLPRIQGTGTTGN